MNQKGKLFGPLFLPKVGSDTLQNLIGLKGDKSKRDFVDCGGHILCACSLVISNLHFLLGN